MFVAPAAVSAPICRRIRAAMDVGAAELADVLADDFVRDEHARRALEIDVDARTLRLVDERLDAGRPLIEAFFQTRLGEREGASLLRYEPGGFYGPHRDRARVPAWPAAARRRIALVLFLNTSRETGEEGDFSGGTLRVFSNDSTPFDVVPREGLLVAFPADLIHEVTVVREGRRDAVVDWFY